METRDSVAARASEPTATAALQPRLLGEADGVPQAWLEPRWSIGQAAQQTGVSTDTLRYYDHEGVVVPSSRASGGARRYSDLDLEKISCAHWLREAGVPIATIREFDTLRDQGRQTLSGRRALLVAHCDELRRRRDEINASIATVEKKIAKYGRLIAAATSGAPIPAVQSQACGTHKLRTIHNMAGTRR